MRDCFSGGSHRKLKKNDHIDLRKIPLLANLTCEVPTSVVVPQANVENQTFKDKIQTMNKSILS